jgi:hypothetical protein
LYLQIRGGLRHRTGPELGRVRLAEDDESRVPDASDDLVVLIGDPVVPLGGAFWDAGAEVFIHKGVNGRWKDTLTPAEAAEYEARAVQELGPECAHWLATGDRRAR